MQIYVLTNSLDIGQITNVCNCNQCKDRGSVELTINYLDGSFMLQTTIQDILHRIDVIAVSDNIDELRNMKETMQFSDSHLCKYLENALLETD